MNQIVRVEIRVNLTRW